MIFSFQLAVLANETEEAFVRRISKCQGLVALDFATTKKKDMKADDAQCIFMFLTIITSVIKFNLLGYSGIPYPDIHFY